MPVYNYGKMFNKSIESVFNSTYKNFELIIVNDGSTDEYIIKKLESLGFKVVSKKHNQVDRYVLIKK
jgi:glycosyltransferase involved in cell wall biosynthesis